MVKLGIIQTRAYSSRANAYKHVSNLVEGLGKKETDVVCLPEQWLKDNKILDFDSEFKQFKKIAKNYSMTVIPGAFYQKKGRRYAISSPIIGPKGEIIGIQEKIHPFGYEKKSIIPGKQAKVFKTSCKFGILICYDMVFPDVSKTLVKKGAEVLFSPSRIVRPGINPWHLYVQVRALENRIPILAANMENIRFGGNSIIVDLVEKNGIVIPKIVSKLKGQKAVSKNFNLSKYKKGRLSRFSDARKFS